MPSKEIVERDRERRNKRLAKEPNIREKLLAQRKLDRQITKGKSRRWEELISRIPVAVETVGAEVGVWKGATAQQVLQKRPLNLHIMVDPWKRPDENSRYAKASGVVQKKDQEEFEEAFAEVQSIAKRYGKRAIIMREYSKDAVGKIEDHSLDYVFIDAEHTYEGVKEDIEFWLPKVKHGGWIGGHDYDNLPSHPGVKKAVDEAFPEGLELGADHTWWWRNIQ